MSITNYNVHHLHADVHVYTHTPYYKVVLSVHVLILVTVGGAVLGTLAVLRVFFEAIFGGVGQSAPDHQVVEVAVVGTIIQYGIYHLGSGIPL